MIQSMIHSIRPRRHGFTLVELLVVITIIVILASLVFVVTRNIKTRAYEANALNTLRQVATFQVGYATENNGDINTIRWVGDPKEKRQGRFVGDSFWGRFQSFLFSDSAPNNQNELKKEMKQRLNQLFNTPNASTMVNTVLHKSRIYHDGSGLPVPLATNQNLYQWNKYLKVNNFGDPSRTLYAIYGFGMFNEEDGRTYVPRPTDGSKPSNNIYYLKGGKALGAFLDGHVETLNAPMPDRWFE